MLLHLIKKDLLIAKKFILISLALITAIPFFLIAAGAEFEGLGIIAFLYMLFFGVVLIFQTVSQMDAKNPKATALICATPYTRKAVVQAKYILFLLTFLYCYGVHTVIMRFIRPDYVLSLTALLTALFIMTVLCGIIIPVELRYGNVKSKFIFMAMIFSFSLGPALVTRLLAGVNITFSLPALSGNGLNAVLIAGTILAAGISMSISMNIYGHKDI